MLTQETRQQIKRNKKFKYNLVCILQKLLLPIVYIGSLFILFTKKMLNFQCTAIIMIFIMFGLPFLWIYLFKLMKKKILLKNTRPKQQPIIIEKSFSLPKNNFQYFFDILGWILIPLYPFSFFVAIFGENSSVYKFLIRCDWKTRRRRSAYCIVMAMFCFLLLLYGYYLEQTHNTFLFITTIIILMVLKIKFLSVELKELNEEQKNTKENDIEVHNLSININFLYLLVTILYLITFFLPTILALMYWFHYINNQSSLASKCIYIEMFFIIFLVGTPLCKLLTKKENQISEN